MTKATINPIKKSRGRPPVDSDQLNVRVLREELAAIDAYAATQPDAPGRTKAARRILREWLIANGFLRSAN